MDNAPQEWASLAPSLDMDELLAASTPDSNFTQSPISPFSGGSPESSYDGIPSPPQLQTQDPSQNQAIPTQPVVQSTHQDPVQQLWEWLQLGAVPDGVEVLEPPFLNAITSLLYNLSSTPLEAFQALIHKRHPDERKAWQMYLGKGTGRQGISLSKNKTNAVKLGGKVFEHKIPGQSVSLEYQTDSPPNGLKHLVAHAFSLVFGEKDEKGEKAKKRKVSSSAPQGIQHYDLRIFIIMLSKNDLKIQHATTPSTTTTPNATPTTVNNNIYYDENNNNSNNNYVNNNNSMAQQDPQWRAQDGKLVTDSNVRVNGSFFATHYEGLSDRTTKENIEPVGGALADINKLGVYQYNHKKEYADQNRTTRGIMAQDLQQVLPEAVREIVGTDGKYDGKLAVNHNAVLYTNVAAMQEITTVKCLAECISQIDAGAKFKRYIRAISDTLPPLPPLSDDSPTPLQRILASKLVQGENQNALKLDTKPTTEMLSKCLRGALRVYDREMGGSKTGEQELEDDRIAEEREKGMTPVQRLKRIDELMEEWRTKRAKVNQAWEIQCVDCDNQLCYLSQCHFYFSNESKKYYMVTDVGTKEWEGDIKERLHTDGDTNYTNDLLCGACEQLIGHIARNRGKGSPKPEILVRAVKFLNSKKNICETSKKTAHDVYDYFIKDLAVERRETTMEDQIAEAKEEEERKVASFPESTRIRVRAAQQPGAVGTTIICKRQDRIQHLIEAVHKELPKAAFDALSLSDTMLDILDPNKFVNDLLNNDDAVYYGLFPQNENIINLRKYQKELLNHAVKSNCAVVCPTGSGKTAVAVEVERKLRSVKQNFKTVMVVRDLPLSVQQYNYFMENTRKLRINLINSDRPLMQTWEEMLSIYDIVVLTAQVLLNNLDAGKAQLSKLDLLILDEAHHTSKKHPFNKIMREHYHTLPLNERPRVLALTASPPAHIGLERTKTLIQEFEDSTGCRIIMVDEYKTELRDDISIPETIVHQIVPSKYEKLLLELLNSAMNSIEKSKKEPTDDAFERAVLRGSPEYDKNCTGSSKEMEELKFLNLVLMSLNDDSDAEGLLKTKEDEYASVKKILSGLSVVKDRDKARTEIFLQTLETFKDVPNFRGIVFVATKLGGEQICKTIQERGLKFIKPHTFFGHQDKNGLAMTSSEQQKVIKKFKDGDVNLLIATSVAEEGLDLTACNVVFRIDSVFSHRSLIQTRGRARQKNSKFFVFYLENSPASRAWDASVQKLKNMLTVVGENLDNSPFMSPIKIRRFSDVGKQIEVEPSSPQRITPPTEPPPLQTICEKTKSLNISSDLDAGNTSSNVEGTENEESNGADESDEDTSESDEETPLNRPPLKLALMRFPLMPLTPIAVPTPLPVPANHGSAPTQAPVPISKPALEPQPKPAIASQPPGPSKSPSPKPSPKPTPLTTPNSSIIPATPSTPPTTPSAAGPKAPTPTAPVTPTSPPAAKQPATPKNASQEMHELFAQRKIATTFNEEQVLIQKDPPKSDWRVYVVLSGIDGNPVEFSGTASTKAAAKLAMATQVVARKDEWRNPEAK